MKSNTCAKPVWVSLLAILLLMVSFHPLYRASEIVYPKEAWQTSTPEQQGMQSQRLADMMDTIEKTGFCIDSISVVRNGFMVLDAYFWPFSRGQKHRIHSCTKSIMSALIGIAMDKGFIQSVDQPVRDFFPDKVLANDSGLKQSISLENLLTMASGLQCQDSYLYRWQGLFDMQASTDWAQYVLDLPMVEPPGTRFEYCNGVSHLLSVIIQQSTRMKTLDFARQHLFDPLGIVDIRWAVSPQLVDVGFGRMWLKPHDMAKFGWLYLNQGRWEGRQIIPAAWVDVSTRKHIDATLFDGYGYQWWVDPAGYYVAVGFKGQRIFVLPGKNMVVVFTGDLIGSSSLISKKLLDEFIIPASASPNPLPPDAAAQSRIHASIQRVGQVPSNGLTWLSKTEGLARDGVFKRDAPPAFTFEYPLGSRKTARDYPGQIMKMKTPGDMEFSAFVGDIPEGVALEDFGPRLYAGELTKFGSDVQVVVQQKISLACGTPAYRTEFDWRFDHTIPTRTYLVVAYKDGRYAFVDAHPWKESFVAERIVMSLRFE